MPDPDCVQSKMRGGGYLSGEGVLTNTNSTGHSFSTISVMLQPSQIPGAATLAEGSPGERPPPCPARA